MTEWTKDELTKIGSAEELQIASLRRDGTLRKPVTIWVVRDGDSLHVRSVKGPPAGGLAYPAPMCLVSPGKHLSGLYEFGNSTGISDEATAVTERPGWRDAPGGVCARALGPASACVAGPIGADHALPDP